MLADPASTVTGMDDLITPEQRYRDVLHHQAAGERHRLEQLAAANDQASFDQLVALRPPPDGRFLELGSGLGTLVRRLAVEFPSAEVVATDLDSGFVEEHLEPNMVALRHDVTTDDFPDSSFDLIFARSLLSVLRERESLLPRIARWLKPGGLLVLEDPSTHPVTDARHEGYRRMFLSGERLAAERIGLDGSWATRLPAPLARAGLVDCGVRAREEPIRGNTPWAHFWRLTAEAICPAAVQTGELSESDLAAGLAALRDPDFSDHGPYMIAAWGRRR